MTLKRIDHVNIVVTNLERSKAFYGAILGLKVVFEAELSGPWISRVTGVEDVKAQYVILEPPEGGCRIELIEYEKPEGITSNSISEVNATGLRHLAFQVENIDEVVDRLTAKGVKFNSDPVAVSSAVASAPKAKGKKLCYFRDPDGVILEIAEYTGN